MRQFTPLLLGLVASAGLIGAATWGVYAIGQLEQQRQHQQSLEKLLESSEEKGSARSGSGGDSSHQASHAEKGHSQHSNHPEPSTLPASTLTPIPIGAPDNPIVRVALLSQSPPHAVELTGQASCQLNNRTVIHTDSLNRILDQQQPSLVTCQSGHHGSIVVNQKHYPETIFFLNRGTGWLVINQLSLERYVASVVGAEMPSHWNPEALKAQAVAARSYALVHLVRPADSDFNLGDTTRWQAYGGLNSQSPATAAATQSTRGLVLTFRGGLVESLYASTNEIVAEAHSHLGASMSQHGYWDMAKKGLKFNEILSLYYRGASLARLKTNES